MIRRSCTRCHTVYSKDVPENGCSSCALSFCNDCLSHRLLLPSIAPSPVTVCASCYIKHTKAIPVPAAQNWWGDGLPPPSFRKQFAAYPVKPGSTIQPKPNVSAKSALETEVAATSSHPRLKEGHDLSVPAKGLLNGPSLEELQKRIAALDEDEQPKAREATISELEERIAALRGVDVELVRNPRLWFETAKDDELTAETPEGLIDQAFSKAAIEKRRLPDHEEKEQRNLKNEKSSSECASKPKEPLSAVDKIEDELEADLAAEEDVVLTPDQEATLKKIMNAAEEAARKVEEEEEKEKSDSKGCHSPAASRPKKKSFFKRIFSS